MIGPFAENSIVVEVGACLDVLAGDGGLTTSSRGRSTSKWQLWHNDCRLSNTLAVM